MATNDGKVNRIYSNFRGVDFRGEEINLVRSPDSLNMWKDYKETESIRTRPGLELNKSFTDAIYGIFFYCGEMIVHSGTKLYKVVDGIKTELYTGLKEAVSGSFVYDNVFYFKDGQNYLQYDGSEIKAVVGYIPTTTIARKPMGGGEKYEDVNMLSEYRKNSFLADGASFSFFLDVMNIDDDFVPEVTIYNNKVYNLVTCSYAAEDTEHKNPIFTKTNNRADISFEVISKMEEYQIAIDIVVEETEEPTETEEPGETEEIVKEVEWITATTTTGETVYCYDEENSLFCCVGGYEDAVISPEEYTVDYAEGKIIFTYLAPDTPLTDGQDNVVVLFKKDVPEYRGCIEKSTMLQVFDNRVFFSGNPDKPNMVWHTSLNDPSYCSDLDYYPEGKDEAAVRGLVAGNNALWVFREPSDANTTVFYHTPSIDDEYGKIYPSSHSSITTGCVGTAINFNDDIVFFSERGMEGMSGDVTTEQIIAHRSAMVDRKLTTEPNYKNMILAEWEGYLLVFIDKKVYLADSRAMFQNENHYEYEWFMWELEQNVICATVKSGILYIGTNDGVYTLTDRTANITSYWVTPLDKFNNPHRQKSTNKRGCVGEATGDISVYAKLEDTDFELIGEYKDITDYFVSRIKRKKFKDIQLKFYSNTRFSLETVTLECFIGGYIKR